MTNETYEIVIGVLQGLAICLCGGAAWLLMAMCMVALGWI